MAPALQGFLACLGLIVAIGAQNALVLRQGIRREHVPAVVTVCALADAVLIAAGIAGLGSVLVAHPATLTVARYGGAAFLLVLAAQAALRARRTERLAASGGAVVGLRAVLVTTLAVTLGNPHVYLDTVVLLGALANQHGTTGRWGFGAGAVLASLGWFCTLGFGARRLRPLFARPGAWRVLDILVAAVMAAVAVSLLV